jgi:hypothetical protein
MRRLVGVYTLAACPIFEKVQVVHKATYVTATRVYCTRPHDQGRLNQCLGIVVIRGMV